MPSRLDGTKRRRPRSPRRLGFVIVLALAALLGGVLGWHLLLARTTQALHPSRMATRPSVGASPSGEASSSVQAAADLSALNVWASEAQHLSAQTATLKVQAGHQHQAIVHATAAFAARNPQATAPVAQVSALQTDADQLAQKAHTLRKVQTHAAAKMPPGGAASSRQRARKLVRAIRHDAQKAAADATTVQSWVQQAKAAVAQFQKVRDAAPGVLGARVQNAKADWTVQGCEVVDAPPGTSAAQMGLVGSRQRVDPVGDVITALTDVTDQHHRWAIPNCAALKTAMVWTRPGDHVVIRYDHRKVIWYELNGRWVPKSTIGTLGGAAGPACPAGISGTITSAFTGNRIALHIALVGPQATRTGIRVILDTGGVQDFFPNRLLRQLGFVPFRKTATGGLVPGATAPAYLYHIPGSALQIQDQGHRVALARGTLTVMGIVGGTLYGLGPDILKHGSSLTTTGNRWTLVPPCPAPAGAG